jgi:hypothetical protein
MKFAKNSFSLFTPVFADQPSRAFREETRRNCQSTCIFKMDLEITYNTNAIWTKDGHACKREGSLHAQLPLMLAVPTTIPEAMSEPTNHEALNIEVIIGRSFG